MNKDGEVKAGTTPCCVCGTPSVDGKYCEHHRPVGVGARIPKTGGLDEKTKPRTLDEEFLDAQH